MATCIYCGKPAGFFRWFHKQCRELHKTAATKIPELFVEALESSMEPSKVHALAEKIARTHYVADTEIRKLAIRGLRSTIDKACEQHGLSEHDDQRIVGLCNSFGVTANELGRTGTRFAKAEILLRLGEGRLPSKISVEHLPINLEHNESVVWAFDHVTYYTTRSRTQYVGSSSGVSIRVMRSVSIVPAHIAVIP
jgi:hypothetical protein